MASLIEVHTAGEMERVLQLDDVQLLVGPHTRPLLCIYCYRNLRNGKTQGDLFKHCTFRLNLSRPCHCIHPTHICLRSVDNLTSTRPCHTSISRLNLRHFHL